MFRSLRVNSDVLERIDAWLRSSPENDGLASGPLVKVIWSLYERQTAGIATSLRQVHHAAGLSQSQALSAVAELERARIVQIDRNMIDAFESVIALVDEAHRHLARIDRGHSGAQDQV